MSQERKTVSWILIAAIVAVAGTALVVTTLASSSPDPSAPPAPTAAQSALPSVQPSAAPQMTSTADDTANASVIGYGGPVLVRLTLDDKGTITGLKVGGTRFAETEGVGSRVKEESFAQSFLDKKPPLKLNEDVDAISGATISSQAAVDAVNAAAEFLSQKEAPSDNN